MARAKFIKKYYGRGYEKDYVYLEYEYKGHKYEVYENRAKGNEPLSWQHKNAQAEIDRQIELKEKEKEKEKDTKPIDWDKEMNEIFEMLGW